MGQIRVFAQGGFFLPRGLFGGVSLLLALPPRNRSSLEGGPGGGAGFCCVWPDFPRPTLELGEEEPDPLGVVFLRSARVKQRLFERVGTRLELLFQLQGKLFPVHNLQQVCNARPDRYPHFHAHPVSPRHPPTTPTTYSNSNKLGGKKKTPDGCRRVGRLGPLSVGVGRSRRSLDCANRLRRSRYIGLSVTLFGVVGYVVWCARSIHRQPWAVREEVEEEI